ncbi:MAG: hypothetical protein OXE50_13330, partial [Chloroflexi bacterium]|nr:hypothetical protein [Chloroflexota bacterium]
MPRLSRTISSPWRAAAIAAVALLALVVAAACSPEPTPTPTPTATPTPTPTPTPVPTPTPAPAADEAAMSMRDFVLDASTTGKDLFDRLSGQENGCVKGVLGDAVYEVMLGMPLLAAGGDAASAAPLFACLAPENVVLLGMAFLGAGGGYSAESQACLTDLALQHPEIIFARLGIEYAGEASYQHTETHNVLLG